jgi:uncharacterized protein
MRSGVDVVYQAAFFDGRSGGQADFLLRVETPSQLGAWSYEIADTKLARRLKVPALLQMATYADHLEQLQGVAPDRICVVTGDGQRHAWRLVDVAAYARHVRAGLRRFLEERPSTESRPVSHCSQCRWSQRCEQEWADRDDLSLVAFMRADHREALRAHGITTLAGLAAREPADLPTAIGRASRERLVQQAREQRREAETGAPSYLLLPPQPRIGLLRLPPPSFGDLYLDFEGDPYAEEGEGREYLAGIGHRDDGFTALWAHSRTEERELTASLVDLLMERWRAYPDMHVYHYAPYETTALKRLTARHGVRETELDQLLRGERFVDLYAVVRQGMRISKDSYSIKKLEALYWDAERSHTDEVSDAMASVIAYERWLVEPDDATLPQIEAYNREDVRSTHALHNWLEERRGELEEAHGPQPRPHEEPEEPKDLSQAELAEVALSERLREAGHPLMADLIQWHRREARPKWWDFFRLGGLDDDELIDDPTALGPLSAPQLVGQEKQSRLWRYTFEPQDTRVVVGKQIVDIDDHESAGTVAELDSVAGYIVVKRKADPKHSRAFGPQKPIPDDVLRAAIAEAGQALLEGRHCLGHALLRRRVPPGTKVRPGETASAAVLRVGHILDGTVLAVQGPPGSGKTTTGAQLIRALLKDGKTVGVTATSHAVIGNLLKEVGERALQKCGPAEHCGSDDVELTSSNNAVAAALGSGSVQLVGGTAWLWASEAMAGAVDVLVIDEAGQFSLANAIAVARGARSIVLLGDPQQLAQPSQGTHPDGAGVSALEYLLDGHDTIPAERGIFLDTSWRMHPHITAYVSDLAYEGRLKSAPNRELQEVRPGGIVSGSGIRLVSISHTGNRARSIEEARVVAEIWQSLQGVKHVDKDGSVQALRADDVLIVAPYNNQVAEIAARLPHARVGTVDKFQGQQAPVVIYSLTSSSAEDAPRGVEFLYDLHRLNVAVSRAQALAVVVMSPALLDAAVRTPEQLRRVNALCRLVEHSVGQSSA